MRRQHQIDGMLLPARRQQEHHQHHSIEAGVAGAPELEIKRRPLRQNERRPPSLSQTASLGERPTSRRRRSLGAAGRITSSSDRRAVRHGHDDHRVVRHDHDDRRRLEPPGPPPEIQTPPPAQDRQRNPVPSEAGPATTAAGAGGRGGKQGWGTAVLRVSPPGRHERGDTGGGGVLSKILEA
jgi:hypothetical protein